MPYRIASRPGEAKSYFIASFLQRIASRSFLPSFAACEQARRLHSEADATDCGAQDLWSSCLPAVEIGTPLARRLLWASRDIEEQAAPSRSADA